MKIRVYFLLVFFCGKEGLLLVEKAKRDVLGSRWIASLRSPAWRVMN